MNEVSKGAYMCPDTGGSYSHRRARYFGPYAEKTVSQIHEIRALVAVAVDQESVDVRWQNTGESIEDLTNDAISHVQMYADRVVENASTPLQVFLLGEPHSTNFRKDSRGGMFQSKKYFWDIARDCSDAKSLADKLTNRGWSDF